MHTDINYDIWKSRLEIKHAYLESQGSSKVFGRKYLEIAQHEVSCDFLESVPHCTLLKSKHQASSGMWLKLALSLLSY